MQLLNEWLADCVHMIQLDERLHVLDGWYIVTFLPLLLSPWPRPAAGWSAMPTKATDGSLGDYKLLAISSRA